MNEKTNSEKVKISSLGKKNREQKIFYWAVLALPLLHLLIFYFIVNFRSILFSFQKYNNTTQTYFGFTFQNIAQVFKDVTFDPLLVDAAKNSMLLYLCGLIFGTGLGLLFSFYIYKKYFAAEFFRVMLFLPQIISATVLALIYKFMVEEAIAPILLNMGIEPPMLSDSQQGFWLILFFTLWLGFGTSVLMYTSSMSGISESIVESASLDGITPLKEFWFITLPMIYPTLVTFLTVGIAGIFTNQMNLFTIWGASQIPEGQYTFGYYLYREVQKGDKATFPYLSAFGLSITVIVAPITLIVKHLLEKYGPSVER